MGQVIGTVNVQVNRQQNATVRSISYGSRTLRGATDLLIDGASTGDVIVYNSDSKTFVVEPVSMAVGDIDGGIF